MKNTKNERPANAGLSVRLPKSSCDDYFFFEVFLLELAFLVEAFLVEAFLEALFFAAISAHHLSCRTGPPGRASWHHTPEFFRQTGSRE